MNTLMSTRMSRSIYHNWIDIAKLIGLYLMLLGHGLVSERITQFIYSFHMPLFFMLSGILYKKVNMKTTFLNGTKRLLVPYFLLNTIGIAYDIIEKHLVGKTLSLLDIYGRIGAVFMGLGYNAGIWHPVLSATWYLYTLFLIQLLFSLSNKYKNAISFLLPILSITIVLLLNYYKINTWIPIDSALLAFPFFFLGTLIKDRDLRIKMNMGGVIVVLFLISILIILDSVNGRVDINNFISGNNLLLFYLSGTIGSFLVIGICQNINISIRKYISGSMLIIAFNLLVIGYVKTIFKILHIEITFIVSVILAMVVLLLFYPLIIFTSRYFPALIGYRKKC